MKTPTTTSLFALGLALASPAIAQDRTTRRPTGRRRAAALRRRRFG